MTRGGSLAGTPIAVSANCGEKRGVVYSSASGPKESGRSSARVVVR